MIQLRIRFPLHHFPDKIPQPQNEKLTVTLLGGGAALELFGLIYFYNEQKQRLRIVDLIVIEKVAQWDEVRSLFTKVTLKNFFPKVRINEVKIDTDLCAPCHDRFAKYQEHLLNCDILMCYNVLNENEVHEQPMIIENLKYIILLNKKLLLLLLMEPSPAKVIPRVNPFKHFLVVNSDVIIDDTKQYHFDIEPLRIKLGDDEEELNHKLFSERPGDARPVFYNSISRISFAAAKDPNKGISDLQAFAQTLEARERQRGKFRVRRGLEPQKRQEQTNLFRSLLEKPDQEQEKLVMAEKPKVGLEEE